MLAFTIFAAYLATGLWLIRPVRADAKRNEHTLQVGIVGLVIAVIAVHGAGLTGGVIFNQTTGLGLADVLNIIAWLFAAIGLFAALQPGFSVLAGIVFCLSAALIGGSLALPAAVDHALTWQLKLHAVLSLIAYSFLAAGAVLAAASLIKDTQLRAARVSRLSAVLPPLLATERLLATLTTSGFVFLLLAITSGFVFVDNLFAQHLTHKSALSVGALAIFGLLVIGRQVAGWRGRRMLQLYLTGFAILVLAYFGSKIVLEFVLNRSWG
ncbi:MAG: cytochrome c biogenesis protein CcsA [Pseudomonadota bacterium]